jgi:hypothetical protein
MSPLRLISWLLSRIEVVDSGEYVDSGEDRVNDLHWYVPPVGGKSETSLVSHISLDNLSRDERRKLLVKSMRPDECSLSDE